jgi:hypothetical protein
MNMVNCDDWIQPAEETEMLISDEWVRYADWVISQLAVGQSHPKEKDRICKDSQPNGVDKLKN